MHHRVHLWEVDLCFQQFHRRIYRAVDRVLPVLVLPSGKSSVRLVFFVFEEINLCMILFVRNIMTIRCTQKKKERERDELTRTERQCTLILSSLEWLNLEDLLHE